MFEGFKVKRSTWDIAGDYEVEGFYEKELIIDSNIRDAQSNVERRRVTHQFSIYVEGT